jgi:hypothetical protein
VEFSVDENRNNPMDQSELLTVMAAFRCPSGYDISILIFKRSSTFTIASYNMYEDFFEMPELGHDRRSRAGVLAFDLIVLPSEFISSLLTFAPILRLKCPFAELRTDPPIDNE